MCECLAWHHPVFALAGERLKKLGIKGGRPLAFSVFAAMRDDPVLAGLPSVQDKVAVMGLGFNETHLVVALAVAALQQLGLVGAAGELLIADENADEMTKGVTEHFVTRRRGRPPLGSRAMTGAERTARWKAGKSAIIDRPAYNSGAVGSAHAADETDDASLSSAPSLSFFPEVPQQEEQKQTRASAEADEIAAGFIRLRALWPLSNRTADTEREYRRALRFASPGRLMELAQHYFDAKPDWQSTKFLVNWLRTEPWRDPVLPLRVPLQAVSVDVEPGPMPRSPNWVARLTELKASGVWPNEWGPAWGEPGCQAPSAETGVGQGFARYFAHHRTTKRSA